MAFYQNAIGKSRKEKQQQAQARGGYADEGSQYSGNRGGAGRGKSFGKGGAQGHYGDSADRKPYSGSYADRKPRPSGNADRKPYSNDNRFDDRKPRPSGNADRKPYSNDNRFDDRKPRPNGNRFDDRKPYSNDNRFDDRKPRPNGNRFDDRKPYSNDNRFDDRKPRPNGNRFDDRKPYASDGHPVSFRDRPRSTPQGERPQMDRNAPRDFKKSGNYRFSTGMPSRYDDRGSGMTPQPYNEQRRARSQEDPGYNSYRYNGPAAYDVAQDAEEHDLVPNENLLSGRNPIREALKSGRDIEKLLVARGELSGSAREIVQMAKERRVPVQEVDRSRLDDITHNHQGMLAFASAYQYSNLDAMLALAQERNEAPFLVLLDGITDPHNLGAIIRTAECAGAHGVIVEERRAVGLTPAAVKASAGAIEHIPVARITNLSNTIQSLKERNIWVYAADMEGEDYGTVNFDGAVALVIGAEGEGVGRRVLDTCDKAVSIPLKGKLDSLNASVAAGILMYAVARTR
ncbi:MAG: 23S rRNA (guanosine(2251)-2'-O)-methyltransferase RlmB [Eubacteriales bacterium]|nr:23S rRNA (guanosine(2251)-2'-O)-methyltransferase RlmB [Eubacteriales bacterium]